MNKIFVMPKNQDLRQPGIEPGSAAWKATMLTITPLTLVEFLEISFIQKTNLFSATGRRTDCRTQNVLTSSVIMKQ